jgi:hypothetical protein
MTDQQRVIISGATGLIGRALSRTLAERGYAVTVLSRDPASARAKVPEAAAHVAWNASEGGDWEATLDGAYAVVHLAGASVAGKRWTPSYKREILESRTCSSRALVEAMRRAAVRPQVYVTASGIDYYGPRGDEPVDETTPAGRSFLAEVCVAWEGEALRAESLGVRVAAVRIGLVLDKHEGALAKLLLPFSLGAGGPVLPGTQWWSWVHLADVIGVFLLAIKNEQARGPLNATSPEPARNHDFATTLGRVLNRPAVVPVPLFPLQIALGEMAGPLLVERQRVIPKRTLELGYRFAYPTLEPALRAILQS